MSYYQQPASSAASQPVYAPPGGQPVYVPPAGQAAGQPVYYPPPPAAGTAQPVYAPPAGQPAYPPPQYSTTPGYTPTPGAAPVQQQPQQPYNYSYPQGTQAPSPHGVGAGVPQYYPQQPPIAGQPQPVIQQQQPAPQQGGQQPGQPQGQQQQGSGSKIGATLTNFLKDVAYQVSHTAQQAVNMVSPGSYAVCNRQHSMQRYNTRKPFSHKSDRWQCVGCQQWYGYTGWFFSCDHCYTEGVAYDLCSTCVTKLTSV